jgi:hypothetical protein
MTSRKYLYLNSLQIPVPNSLTAFSIATFLVFSMALGLSAQTVTIAGKASDNKTDEAIEFATVYVDGTANNTQTDINGLYELVIPRGGKITLVFSRLGYTDLRKDIRANKDRYNIYVRMEQMESDIEVIVTDSKIEDRQMVRETTEGMKLLPSITGNIESVLPHIALGARSGTGGELSSQYNVRGGNYDENLVYVNDFEIFRPQLLRSNQQEGLSFPNIDLIRDLSFSSGGYESKYGDKMSSVLDIYYKRPTETKGSLSMSLLGASGHIEGVAGTSDNRPPKFRYLLGARYKDTRYVLGSLDTEGQYSPVFADVQTYLTYDVTDELQFGLLANYNESKYDFIPTTRSTGLGLIDFTLELNSVFQGGESDQFRTGMVGTSVTYLPNRDRNPMFIKLLASTYRGREVEGIDISGSYRLSQVETSTNETAGQEVALIGIGTQHQYTRNRLFNRISDIQLRGGIEFQSAGDEKAHFVQWGLQYRQEYFDDRINEWELLDSAGYSLPSSDTEVLLSDVLKVEQIISSAKSTAYIQDSYTAFGADGAESKMTLGSRFSYWNLNKEFNISPRFQLLYKPAGIKDISYKLAGGVYYQTPFYRELRRLDGTLNTDIKAQKSIHLVAGMTSDFIWHKVSDKPFRFILEGYYKKLSNLISYDIDNVRIRYTGENDASGYAMGLDARLNGEFVPGAESWFNISFLSTKESIDDIQHTAFNRNEQSFEDVDNVSRPTDQLLYFSIFFQDYLPRNENFKVNVNLTFGGGLPFGLPESNVVTRNTFRFAAYRRVDMGFALQMWNKSWRNEKPKHFLRGLDNAWISLEVFNLMGIENVSSNTWVKSIFQQQFAVPNKLTTRRVNLKFRVEF